MARWRCGATPRGGTAPDGPVTQHGAGAASARVSEIISALDVLADNPLIGRPAGDDRGELLIGRDAHGCLALYRYLAGVDMSLVLAIRSQREAGYARP